MRILLLPVLLALSVLATAAPKKRPVPAVPAVAVPAVPARPSPDSGKAGTPTLIDSDLNGREMLFIGQAIDLGKAMRYLASQTSRTPNPALRGFGDDLVKTLAAQSAVLNTVAEMRKISVPEGPSATETAMTAKISRLEGIKLEKALLDAFIDLDHRMIATYELGSKSDDVTIRKFVDQTLPQAREHLVVVEAMAGIAPKRISSQSPPPAAPAERQGTPIGKTEPVAANPQPEQTASPAKPARPAFRTNIKQPADSAVPRSR